MGFCLQIKRENFNPRIEGRRKITKITTRIILVYERIGPPEKFPVKAVSVMQTESSQF